MSDHHSVSVRVVVVTAIGLLMNNACSGSGSDNGRPVSGGQGASTSTGGKVATGGSFAASKPTSAATGAGGSAATGGIAATGGTTPEGGAKASGGTTTAGGTTTTGGSTAAGGTKTTSNTTPAGGSNTAGGSASIGGTKASGGTLNTFGSTAAGGTKTAGNTTISAGGTTAAGGTPSTGADQCKPIGWATRTARDGSTFSVTGGGNATPVVVTTFADLKTYAADGQARVLYVDGNLGSGWAGSSGDRLEIKSNKTIVGIRPATQLKAAIHINGSSNVILRNIVIRGPGSNQDQAWDKINIEGASKNIWVDHCEFWDGQDGNADVVKGADTVTFTWNIFGYALSGHSHNLSNLIASSDSEPESEGKLDITFMFNWWVAAKERQPRCRYGYIHVVNNLFTANGSVGASSLGVTNGYMCNVRTENNHFINQSEPIDLGKQAGTGSVQEALGNLFESCTGNQKGSGTSFTPPYEYKSLMLPASQVKALVQQNAGATLGSPTACQ